VLASSPPAKQYTNKKFHLIQDTLPLPGRFQLQSEKYLKSLVKQHLSSREIGRELNISHQTVLSAIEKFGLNGSSGADRQKPGQIPFGWDYVDYQLKKNREEQEVIRIIKQLKSTGFSLRGISSELNKQLVPTKNNGIWHANTVKKILERV
jgi:orotate phosphoribosyltransferase-like protein